MKDARKRNHKLSLFCVFKKIWKMNYTQLKLRTTENRIKQKIFL